MTNKEAIKILKENYPDRYTEFREAVDLAIIALDVNDKLIDQANRDECYDCQYKIRL